MTANVITVFVEDPGAANMVVGLGPELAAHGLSIDLWATGAACDHLIARHTAFNDAGRERPSPRGVGLAVIGTSESPDTVGFEIAAQARANGVVTVGLVDSPASAADRFRGTTNDPLAHLPEHLIVTDERTRAAFLDLGVPSTRISIAANPALLRARARAETNMKLPRADRKKSLFGPGTNPVIVFLTELSDGLDPDAFRRADDYTMTGRGGSDARTDIVLETLLDVIQVLSPRPRLVLRLHPKEAPNAYDAYADEVDGISTGGDPLDVCEAADLVIGMTTTLLSEARQLGQKVLSALPRAAERDWSAGIATGDILCLTDPKDLAPTIAHMLAEPRQIPPAPVGAPLADVLATLVTDRSRETRTGTG